MRPAERETWGWNLIKDDLGAVKHYHPHPKAIINHELKQPGSWNCRKAWAEKLGLELCEESPSFKKSFWVEKNQKGVS